MNNEIELSADRNFWDTCRERACLVQRKTGELFKKDLLEDRLSILDLLMGERAHITSTFLVPTEASYRAGVPFRHEENGFARFISAGQTLMLGQKAACRRMTQGAVSPCDPK